MSLVDGPSYEREFIAMGGQHQFLPHVMDATKCRLCGNLYSDKVHATDRKAVSIYIASPFFTPEQLAVVEHVEHTLKYVGLSYYSPRHDGVLKDMPPEERLKAGPKLFKMNCEMVCACDAVLALMDYKDTGTTWETGYAFGLGHPVLGYRTDPNQPLNVMLQQCFHAIVYGKEELSMMLATYAKGGALDRWEVRKKGEAY